MLDKLRKTITSVLSNIEINQEVESTSEQSESSQISNQSKIPRNALCPCGSGIKYKHCHGKL